MKKRILFFKILSLCLIFVLLIPMLLSCKTRAVPAGKLALTSVGTVDGNEVLYEELYYLASNYLPSLKAKYGDDTDALRSALYESVSKNITANYAILGLCRDAGVSVDEEALDDGIQAQIDSLVESDFDGSRSDYREHLKSVGMTDHYMRNSFKIDLLYSELPAKYAESGLLPVGDAAVRDYVTENFVRTRHLAFLVEEGETREENLEKAETALEKYQTGEMTFYKLIGSKYNEDLAPQTSDDGYYWARGSMDKVYEDTAFGLEINGVSGIIESIGQSNLTGANVPCFYIVQRLELDEAYITENLSALEDKCADAIIGKRLEERQATLEFIPNEFFNSLDLLNLEFPEDAFDFFPVMIIGIAVLCVGAVTFVFILFAKRRKKRLALRRASK